MDSYVDYSGQAGFEQIGEDTGDRSSVNQSHYADQASVSSMGDAQQNYFNANGQPSMACDIKPRLTKGQHEMLEAEYLKQNKPSTSTKKGFAEALGVSLDKVNNWFQNRRAKSKQDAKKAAGAYSLFHAQQQSNQLNFSDSEVSPAYPASDYFSMMQQSASDDRATFGHEFSEAQNYPGHRQYNRLPYNAGSSAVGQPPDLGIPSQMPQDMFDSPQELNRRTLTQEQFDAFAHNAGSMGVSGGYDVFQSDFSGNQDVLNQVFPELQDGDKEEQHAYAYPSIVPPPMSSRDSTIPSSVSDQSLATFPSSSSVRDSGAMSSASSEWADSRSSSVSEVYQEDPFAHSHAVHHPAGTTSQWKPGQSVPVDVNALTEQFRQVAQARQASPQQYHTHEQPLAWPADNAYERRLSQTSSMLAQSMSHVGLHTPQPQQHAAFKSPAPPANIAARRQRPRPAALGIASMRSQSYSGAAQPGSPGQAQLCQSPGQSQSHIMTAGVPEQHFQTPSMTMLPQHQHMAPASGALGSLPLQYAHGVPMVNSQGQLELMVPPFMQQQHQQQQQQQQQQQHTHAPTPPQQQTHQTPPPPKADPFESMVGMFSTAAPTPALQVTAQVPKQPPRPSTEFFVHEYSPPAEMKRAATPRKPAEITAPKSYSFANQVPEDFLKKGKKSRGGAVAGGTTANSPASSGS
ncbi:hypothetical protein B0A55_02924 [Friedmanniomyces simplex]|uniref:Homeobox domain-containing protein n=1 Tax=Friedmanniomyces simplex TaxID=329884 RepID=A0A4U0Y0G3_9PEZI|nr:hypothetical protein B0A55_02924 [Friedmanniomyces simplex]